MKNIFSHSGSNGDILFSLTFVREYLEFVKNENENEFFIQINQPAKTMYAHPNGNVIMTENSAKFMIPLLEYTGMFNKVSFGESLNDFENSKDINLINLSYFRKLPINLGSGNIASWYYQLFPPHLPQDYSKPSIVINRKDIDYSFKDKILISKTNRYFNVFIHWKTLEKYKDKFVFIGLEDEYEDFCKNEFKVEYHKISNSLELAKIFAGCKGFIANQSGNFSLAEVMKIPRVLITADFIKFKEKIIAGPVNNIPSGGWFETCTYDERFKAAVENLMHYTGMNI